MERFRCYRPACRERALDWDGLTGAGWRLPRPAGLARPHVADLDLVDLVALAEWAATRDAPLGDPDAGKPPLPPLTAEERAEIAKETALWLPKTEEARRAQARAYARRYRAAHADELRAKNRDCMRRYRERQLGAAGERLFEKEN